MIRLNKNDYYKVLPLINKVGFNHVFARVVVEGKVRGQIFVDDNLNPTVCLVIHRYGMALLCGNYHNENINNKLVEFLKNQSLANNYFNNDSLRWIITYPQNWDNIIASLLGKDLVKLDQIDSNKTNFIIETERVNFKFNHQSILKTVKIPKGFNLKRIDKDIYEKIQGSVIPQHFWDTAEDFLKNGVGYVLLFNEEIISFCFSSFVLGDQLELGIETKAEFRNKGYSIYAANELIKYCLSQGYEPLWACRKENIGSFKLAESLGFLPLSYHPYYCIPIRI